MLWVGRHCVRYPGDSDKSMPEVSQVGLDHAAVRAASFPQSDVQDLCAVPQ